MAGISALTATDCPNVTGHLSAGRKSESTNERAFAGLRAQLPILGRRSCDDHTFGVVAGFGDELIGTHKRNGKKERLPALGMRLLQASTVA